MSEHILNLGCGTDHHNDAINVDANPDANPDQHVDLNDRWPWQTNSVTEIRAYHVLEHLESVEHALQESARVLSPGGVLEVRWPIGMNERADPDHKHTWVWDTPLYYTGARAWDVDVGLTVVRRDVDVHTHVPGIAGEAYKWALRGAKRVYGGGRWAFDMPITSGEFTVVFEA
jgi:SAM-dependent methyltransferase